jgi:phosphoribosyl-dephospho-CoA transferase
MYQWNQKTIRVHDLILLRSSTIFPACLAQPSWVNTALGKAPWVTVRRAAARTGEVAVGVRGNDRHQRWGGFVDRSEILEIATVDQLRPCTLDSSRRSLPALRALECIQHQLRSIQLNWGPTGSVGFELATGRPSTRWESDLDLVIYAPERLERERAREIAAKTTKQPAKIDMRVETPCCGFSLEEYVNARSSPILLRMAAGFRLGADPWAPPTEDGY